ncbi:hypothetical protein [Paenibacillus tundrae]|uniref:hypothetical protein n=1 Tax=Paenibacillus tundrae TaxID=528187 RepID=UPI0030CF9627
MRKIMMVMAGALLLSGCSDNQVILPKENSVENSLESATTAPDLLLAENKNDQVAIYGRAQGDVFSSLTVQIDQASQTYSWSNVSNPSFYPVIYRGSLGTEGKDMIVIVLTKGTGTGIHESEVHVLRPDFTEIPVIDPREFVLKEIQLELHREKALRHYTLKVNEREYSYDIDDRDSSDWFEQPSVQNIIRYDVRDQELVAELPIQIAIGQYLGNAIVKYRLVNGELRPSTVELSVE